MKNKDTERLVAVLRAEFERDAACDAECSRLRANDALGRMKAKAAAYDDLRATRQPALPVLCERMPQWKPNEGVK